MTTSDVAAWYDANAALEDARLDSARLEHSITLRIIKDALTEVAAEQPCSVADIGCGTGRYALDLARLGHRVSISDISQAEVAVAVARATQVGLRFEHAAALDARALSSSPHFRAGEFDLVLLLGPLYHITDARERHRVLESALALVRPGGVLVAAFVTQVAHLRDMAQKDAGRLLREARFYEEYLASGAYAREGSLPMYHSSPEEIEALVGEAVAGRKGAEVRLFGAEGFLGFHHGMKLNGLDEVGMEAWLDLMMRFAGNKFYLGCSDHILAVIRTADGG